MRCFKFYAFMLALLAGISQVNAGYIDKTISSGQTRIIYPSSSPTSCEVIMLGVGTAMSRDSYDNLGAALNAHGYIVAILDHQPGNLTKTDATKFKNLANDIKANLLSWLSGTGVSCSSVAHWIMGGHSAGGQAAQNAVSSTPGLAHAVFHIDPYDISGAGTVSVPSLNWGFDITTCFVDKNKAAKAAYNKSTGQRAMVRVNSPYAFSACGYSPKFYHCSFADGSCPACTSCAFAPASFYTDVATSVKKFITAAFYGTWSKANLNFTSSTPKTYYEGSDVIP
jgi:pimeloyl-ACP methyl ester carboxylesterase